MRPEIKLVPIAKLRAHEQVDPQRLGQLLVRIKQDGHLKNPIVVDKKTLVILDGHHRASGLKRLGCRLVPVMMVNYFDPQIRVFFRRADFKIKLIKVAVLNRGLAGRPFPHKTTRNWIRGRIRGINLPLDRLR